MPGFDRTGPMGGGPMTGGGFGQCSAGEIPEGTYYGRGLRRGRGGGRGWAPRGGFGGGGRAMYVAQMAAPRADDIDSLTVEAQRLEQQLQAVQRRLENLQQKND